MAGSNTSLIRRSAGFVRFVAAGVDGLIQIRDQTVLLARQDALADAFVHGQRVQRGVLVDLFIFLDVQEVAGVVGQRLRMAVEEQVFGQLLFVLRPARCRL